jgi:hypothetical protein
MASDLPFLIGAVGNSATRTHAVDYDADQHERHAYEDHQVGGQLGAGRASVIVMKSRVEVGDQIGRDSEDQDHESDLRSDRESLSGSEGASDGLDNWHGSPSLSATVLGWLQARR